MSITLDRNLDADAASALQAISKDERRLHALVDAINERFVLFDISPLRITRRSDELINVTCTDGGYLYGRRAKSYPIRIVGRTTAQLAADLFRAIAIVGCEIERRWGISSNESEQMQEIDAIDEWLHELAGETYYGRD